MIIYSCIIFIRVSCVSNKDFCILYCILCGPLEQHASWIKQTCLLVLITRLRYHFYVKSLKRITFLSEFMKTLKSTVFMPTIDYGMM